MEKYSGLSSVTAKQQLALSGYNEIATATEDGFFSHLKNIFHEPMFLLLLAGATLYLILGSRLEAVMLLSFVLVIMLITFYQERKSERALVALRNLSSPRALVIRDSVVKRIAGREVVLSDIIVLNEGDRIPADAILLQAENLLIDESILTGEAQAVRKMVNRALHKICRPGGDDLPFVYSGTYVVQGSGIAKVVAVGARTEIGKIGTSLATTQTERTNLQQETDRLVRNFAIFGFALCFVLVFAYALNYGSWLNGMLVGITLAMAILPEEFPVVLTVFLAIGAWRLSLRQVLTRRIPAVEALGAATVLCIDKTGTITRNQMELSQLFAKGKFLVLQHQHKKLPENFHQLLEYAVLASQRNPFDPMEITVKQFAAAKLKNTEHLHEKWHFVHQYPLSKELLAISHVWQSTKKDQEYVIAAKGAPEAIFDLCHLSAARSKQLLKQVLLMANQGLRVIAVAKANLQHKRLPKIQHDFNFEFVGLLGFKDPVRDEVFASVKICYQAGLRVIMLTGDYPGTAQKIAREIKLYNPDEVILGTDLAEMSEAELIAKCKTVNVFARIMPEQKLRIVNALKANKEIVAMTGDGVNDAPALKAAQIGVAMGGRGTDVAREAAAIVLLNDDFASIVTAIKLGRRIFDNIRKAIVYLIAAHIPIIGMSLIPVLFHWPLMLLPMHIVFIELIIDPTCSIVFEAEPEEADVMSRRPRHITERLFNFPTVRKGLYQGLSVLVATLLIYGFAYLQHYSEIQARAMVFTVLVIGNLALIFTNRIRRGSCSDFLRANNTALWLVVGTTFIVLLATLYVPFLANLFHFGAVSGIQLIGCMVLAIFSAMVVKFF